MCMCASATCTQHSDPPQVAGQPPILCALLLHSLAWHTPARHLNSVILSATLNSSGRWPPFMHAGRQRTRSGPHSIPIQIAKRTRMQVLPFKHASPTSIPILRPRESPVAVDVRRADARAVQEAVEKLVEHDKKSDEAFEAWLKTKEKSPNK